MTPETITLYVQVSSKTKHPRLAVVVVLQCSVSTGGSDQETYSTIESTNIFQLKQMVELNIDHCTRFPTGFIYMDCYKLFN